MEYCKNCLFYKAEYDELRQIYNDCIKINAEGDNDHFCIMFDGGIPSEIWNNKRKCKNFTSKI